MEETKIKNGKEVIIKIEKRLDITNFAYEVFQNLPECSISLQCTGWKYEKMRFTFFDPHEDKDHVLTREKIEKGMEIFLIRCLEGKFGDRNLRDPSHLFDLCYWDADIIDMAIQTCIFDEVIYG